MRSKKSFRRVERTCLRHRHGWRAQICSKVNTTTNSRFFLVDTGSEQVLLGLELACQVTKVRTDEWDILRGTSGRVQDVYKADAVKLAFGKLLLQADDVVAFDLTRFSDDAGTEISGFLEAVSKLGTSA